jgi:hypothetical protein
MNMKILIILIATFALLLGSTMAFGEEEKPTASADVGVFTKYIWRGYELSDDSIVFQPSMTAGYKGFSMNLWGNLDSRYKDNDPTTDDKAEWTETDLTLAYDTSFGPVGLGVGYIYYGLDSIQDSQELYLSAGLDVLFSPTLTFYREIAHLPGWYIHFGISRSFQLPKEITLDLAGAVAYYHSDDDEFVNVDSDFNPTTEKYRSLHDGNVSIGLTVPFAKYFAFSPVVAYSFPLSDEADRLLTSASISNDSAFLYGGFTLSIAF